MTTTSAPRRPRRDGIANRAGILAAAQQVLSRDPSASLDTIAQAAGLSRRALYGHFPDRDALLREVIALGAQRFNAIAAAVDDDDPRVALARLAAALWRAAAEVQASASLALDDAHIADTARALEPLRRRVRELAAAGGATGVLRGDVAPDLLAALVEESARGALRTVPGDIPDAASVAVRMVLGAAGLSWREARALLDEHPDLFEED